MVKYTKFDSRSAVLPYSNSAGSTGLNKDSITNQKKSRGDKSENELIHVTGSSRPTNPRARKMVLTEVLVFVFVCNLGYLRFFTARRVRFAS